MVTITCSMPLSTPSGPRFPRKLQVMEADKAALIGIQRPDWTCDVHTHARRLQKDLVEALDVRSCSPMRKPRKEAMTAHTWELVCQKREKRRELAELNLIHTRTMLAAWFACWRHAAVETVHPPLMAAFDGLLAQQDKQIAFVYHQFRCLGRHVTTALRLDDSRFYGALLHDAAEYLSPGQAKQFWTVVRRSLPRFQQRRMTTPPFQVEGLEDQWLSHFGELEAGAEISFHDLAERCWTRQSRCLFGAPSQICLADLPSIIQLEDAFRMTAAGKATGDDPLPSALFHNSATGLASLYHDLLLKEYVWQTEPLDCKGGPIAIIPKSAHPSTVKQYRGILLLGNMAKRTHAILRQQIMTHLAPARAPGQLGGFKGQQVCFGSQALRLFCRLADQRGVSSAVLFLDLASAFHHLVRELVTGVSSSANLTTLLAELQKAGHNGEKIKAAAGLPGILADLGAPECLVRLVRDIHAETWCSLPCGQFLHTHRGTRPGSPLADIVFHILMASVAKRIDKWIEQNQVHLDAFGGVCDDVLAFIPSILWADDIAVPVATSDAQALVPLLQQLLAEVKSYMGELGFTLNFAKGKTSAVVSFRGKNAASLRQQFQLVSKPGIQCSFDDGTEHWLHFVPAYKHLGTVLTSDHGLDIEINCRIGAAKSAFAHLSKPLLTNKHLPLKTRLQLFQALVGTKLFFGLGSWSTPTPKQLQRLSGFWINALKKVMKLSPDRWSMPTAQVIAAADTVGVRARLALDRLLYAQRIFSMGPFFLHHLVHLEHACSPNSWLEGLKADLQWVSDTLPQSLPVGWNQDMTALFEMWQTGGKEWRTLIHRAVRQHKKQEHIMADVHSFHHKIFATLRAVGTEFQPDPFSLVPDECVFSCFCGKSFATNRGLLAHQRRQHHIFSPERPFLQGATCMQCGRYCWTTQRLQQHLSYIPKRLGYNPCFVALQRQGRDVPYEATSFPPAVLGLARREALQTAGPALEQVTVVERQRAEWARELESCLQQLELSTMPEDPLQCGADLGDALSAATRSWFERFYPQGPSELEKQLLPEAWLGAMCDQLETTDLAIDEWVQFAFLAWGDHWLPDIVAQFLDGQAEYDVEDLYADFVADLPRFQMLSRISALRSSLRHVQDEPPRAHRTLVAPAPGPSQHPKVSTKVQQAVPRLFGEQEEWSARLRQCRFANMPEVAACPLYRALPDVPTFLFVHLFSGRRRTGDFHMELQNFALHKPWRVVILSLDTAVSLEYGNLLHHTISWKSLEECYLAGRIAGTLCGPPCETYSEARFTPPPDDSVHWPRPLRSFAQLFGLDGLSTRELCQCHIGGNFFLQCIWALAAHIAYGGIYVAEHPAPPHQEDRPSIWTSAVVQTLLQLPDLVLHCVQQYRWGASAIKPTGLLAWNLPFFRKDLYSFSLPNPTKPDTAAIGKDDQGNFKTAKHKEYPQAFCKALAFAVAQQFDRFVRSHGTRSCPAATEALDHWIAQAAAASTPVRDDGHWLPDFQRL